MNTTPIPVATIQEILTARCGTVLQTIEHNQPLTVSERTNIQGLVVNDDGTEVLDPGIAETVVLTGDGRRYESGWHTGADGDADWVAVERWNSAGRAFHGFLHPVTRRLVQAG